MAIRCPVRIGDGICSSSGNRGRRSRRDGSCGSGGYRRRVMNRKDNKDHLTSESLLVVV